MALLIGIVIIVAVVLYGFFLYAIFSVIRAILKGVFSLFSGSSRNYAGSTQSQSHSPSTRPPASAPNSSVLFTNLRSRRPVDSASPNSPQYMETVYRVVPYQSVTKAVFYYSMGFYSGAKSLLDNSVQHDFRNTELNTAIASLRNQAATKTDRPGAGKIDALQAGNALQAPYSSVLWAIENGHTDQDVVRGLLELFRMQN